MVRYLWAFALAFSLSLFVLGKPTEANAQLAGQGCAAIPDTNSFAFLGSACLAGSGIITPSTPTSSAALTSSTVVWVSNFTNGDAGFFVTLPNSATNITFNGRTLTSISPTENTFEFSGTAAIPFSTTVLFDFGASSFRFSVSKSAGSTTLSGFTISEIVFPSVDLMTDSGGTFNQSSPAPFTATVNFSEPVTGFANGDLTATNATVGPISGVGDTYMATVTPTGNGDVVLGIDADVAQNPSNLGNRAATPVTVAQVDDIAPNLQIINGPASHDGTETFGVTFEFSEDVQNFTQSGINVINGTVSNFNAVDANTYTADITTINNLDISLNVAAGTAQDLIGNNSTPATLNIPFVPDTNAPSVQILNAPSTHNGSSPFTVTLQFSEDVQNFAASDISLTNATASGFVTVDANTYTISITPTVMKNISINIAANVVQDLGGNNNTAAAQVIVPQVDVFAPSVQILNAPTDHNGATPFNVTFEFSEEVKNFVEGNVIVLNGTLSNFEVVDGNTYTADVIPSNTIDIFITVPAGAAQDLKGNNNTASEELAIRGTLAEDTKRAISEFILNRSNSILSSQPNLIGFIKGSNLGGRGRLGELRINANSSEHLLSFATSRSKILSATNGSATSFKKINEITNRGHATLGAHSVDPVTTGSVASKPEFDGYKIRGSINSLNATPVNGSGAVLSKDEIDDASDEEIVAYDVPEFRDRTNTWDIWTNVHNSRTNNGNSESTFGMINIGAHYFVSDSFLVGILGQMDWASETSTTSINSNIDGQGWMVGPFVAGKINNQNLYYEARVGYGQSSNDITPIGTFTDNFDTTRWLASGTVSGSLNVHHVTITPAASFSYYEEEQEAYTDSTGNEIGAQLVSLGEINFGPSFSKLMQVDEQTYIEPSIGVSGIYNFGVTQDDNTSNTALSNGEMRARFDAGLNVYYAGGGNVSFNGFYDGVGFEDFDSFGGDIRFSIPLN